MEQIIPPQEEIEAELYMTLQRNIDLLKGKEQMKRVILADKENCVDSLRRKLEDIRESKGREAYDAYQEKNDIYEQIEEVRRQMDEETYHYRQETDYLKKENAELGKQATMVSA
eukprot:NODE_1130_length_666_cov_535.213938_g884_i0.p1 GENE.NODE_1130_length_666_cov_535.213938_g884_i0~~NODE_1130_length_666_cov_535.213938_g884_i0.p1  ORF type:complete len:114 (+),score=18.63 NODE_1130_length_666_cov_535.213938_g884_i0:150-491(+)